MTVVLADTIEAGHTAEGQVVFTNSGATEVVFDISEPVLGHLVEPGTDDVVGGVSGYRGGTASGVRIAAGGEATATLWVGTAAGPASTVAPGTYEVVVPIPIGVAVPLDYFLAPRVRLTVID